MPNQRDRSSIFDELKIDGCVVVIFVSWLVLLSGLFLLTWFFVIRARGSLRYWIRSHQIDPQWVVGKVFKTSDQDGIAQFFTDGNAVVRSLDRRTNKVIRQWDRKQGTVFLGLVLSALPDGEVPEDYELREFQARRVLRLSGANRLDEQTEIDALKEYAKKHGLSPDLEHPARLSGQSFSVYQWDLLEEEATGENSQIASWAEKTMQLRNNLVIPLLATVLALGLIGTREPILFVLGIGLICFLSGACKFVFIHQMTDEADELHLQNY